MHRYFFRCKLFSVGSQEEPDLEMQAFKICDTNKDFALTWKEVEDCEVCKYLIQMICLNHHFFKILFHIGEVLQFGKLRMSI